MLTTSNNPTRDEMMGHEAWGMGHGAWGIKTGWGHGAYLVLM